MGFCNRRFLKWIDRVNEQKPCLPLRTHQASVQAHIIYEGHTSNERKTNTSDMLTLKSVRYNPTAKPDRCRRSAFMFCGQSQDQQRVSHLCAFLTRLHPRRRAKLKKKRMDDRLPQSYQHTPGWQYTTTRHTRQLRVPRYDTMIRVRSASCRLRSSNRKRQKKRSKTCATPHLDQRLAQSRRVAVLQGVLEVVVCDGQAVKHFLQR